MSLGATAHRLTRQVLEQTLRAHGWHVRPAAASLGVSAYALERECRLYGFGAKVRKAELARERADADTRERDRLRVERARDGSTRRGYAHIHRWTLLGREIAHGERRSFWDCSECGMTRNELTRRRRARKVPNGMRVHAESHAGQYRVLLNGRDVTDRCREADDRAGWVVMLCLDGEHHRVACDTGAAHLMPDADDRVCEIRAAGRVDLIPQ